MTDDLLNNDVKWVWPLRCEEAFQKLKEVIASKTTLRLLDFDLPFEVHSDASYKAIRGILRREFHLVTFKSRKVNDAKANVFHS